MISSPIIADTRGCFYHLVEAYPHLPMLQKIADFCHVVLSTVQTWQAGEFSAVGYQLLRLRCLLYIAGYDVTELAQLNGAVRRLALLLGTSVVSPEDVKNLLKHQRGDDSQSPVWRIVLHNGGLAGKAKIVEEYVSEKERREALDKKLADERKAMAELIEQLEQRHAEPETAVVPASLDPAVISGFVGAVHMTTSLGHAILHAGTSARDEAYTATRNGQDLAELVALLWRLSDPEDAPPLNRSSTE